MANKAYLAAALKKAKKPETDEAEDMESAEETEEGEADEGKLLAAEELIQAVDAKNATAVVAALESLLAMCK